MALSKDQKEKVLEDLKQFIEGSQGIVISEYKGLSVEEISNLRNELRKEGISYKVAKKTLINKAMEAKNLPVLPVEIMKDAQVALAFTDKDEITPFRIIAGIFKKIKKGKLLGGYIGGNLFLEEKANKLASLPSKQELIAKMIGGFKAPLSKFHGVLSNTTGSFVRVLNAIREKQEAA